MAELIGSLEIGGYDGPLVGRASVQWAYLFDASDVLALLGYGAGETVPAAMSAQAEAALSVVVAAARGYTRDRGFRLADGVTLEVAEDVKGALMTATARLLVNPTGSRRIEAGSFSELPGTFNGWTQAELAVLNRYRRRAA